MISDSQAHRDQKEIVVPPLKNFLDVQLTPDKPTYRVRDEAKFIVTTKDHEGKPISAEVEMGVMDEAVLYIQQEYAGDPRQFFFGQKRYQTAMISSTFDYRGFSDGEKKSPKNVTSIPRMRSNYAKSVTGAGASLAMVPAAALGVEDNLSLAKGKESNAVEPR